jgi:hypothetical protein
LFISSATAVPVNSSKPVMDKIDIKEKLAELEDIFNFLDIDSFSLKGNLILIILFVLLFIIVKIINNLSYIIDMIRLFIAIFATALTIPLIVTSLFPALFYFIVYLPFALIIYLTELPFGDFSFLEDWNDIWFLILIIFSMPALIGFYFYTFWESGLNFIEYYDVFVDMVISFFEFILISPPS